MSKFFHPLIEKIRLTFCTLLFSGAYEKQRVNNHTPTPSASLDQYVEKHLILLPGYFWLFQIGKNLGGYYIPEETVFSDDAWMDAAIRSSVNKGITIK